MIYTVTLNPAIDYFITLNNAPMVDEVNRGKNEIFKAGGKGLNVSRDLSILSIPSRAIAVLGGFTGMYIRDSFASDPNITVIPISVTGNNRINLKAHYDHSALCVNGEGPAVDASVQESVLAVMRELAEGDIAIVSGSMMKGFTYEFLGRLSDVIHEQKARLVLDMEQVTQQFLKQCRPWLIKPNLYELKLLLKNDSITSADIEQCVSEVRTLGAENVLVSLGADGAVLITQKDVIWLQQPNTVLVNKVGAGDAMLAAFVGKLSEGCSEEEALRYGGAAGNAVASKLEDISMEDIEAYLPLMTAVTQAHS